MDVAVAPLFADGCAKQGWSRFMCRCTRRRDCPAACAPHPRDQSGRPSVRIRAVCAISEPLLRELGIESIIGGEFEPALVVLADGFRRVRLGRSGRILSNGCSSCRRTGPTSRRSHAIRGSTSPGSRWSRATRRPAAAASTCAGTAPRARVRRQLPRRAAGGGAGGHPPAGRGGRRAHHLRRSRFLQRPTARPSRIVEAFAREFPDSPTT